MATRTKAARPWRGLYYDYALAAAAGTRWLETLGLAEPDAEPNELTVLQDAYEAVHPAIPKRNRGALSALEEFHAAFLRTLEKLEKFDVGPEFVEIRVLRLDQLADKLLPHALLMPSRLKLQLVAAAAVGVAAYALFPESIRANLAAESDAVYLGIIGTLLVLFSSMIAAVVMKGIRSGPYIGTTGVFLLMPSLLNLILMFGLAYWVPSGAAGDCLNEAATRADALYFSLTTFTTTGFGDLKPVTPLCRSIATMQMIATFVVVGSLLTIYLGAASASRR